MRAAAVAILSFRRLSKYRLVVICSNLLRSVHISVIVWSVFPIPLVVLSVLCVCASGLKTLHFVCKDASLAFVLSKTHHAFIHKFDACLIGQLSIGNPKCPTCLQSDGDASDAQGGGLLRLGRRDDSYSNSQYCTFAKQCSVYFILKIFSWSFEGLFITIAPEASASCLEKR